MKLSKYIVAGGLVLSMGLGFTSCNDDDFTKTIFPEVSDDADVNSATYKFDTWLNRNFRDLYNMDFVYRLEDVETNYDYNLTPATLSNAQTLAVLIKYVWYDAYAEAYGSLEKPNYEFLRQVGPKMINLIGSPMYNVTTGTVTLGYASGGVKITLTDVNSANLNNIQALNNFYFHTMHHEYCHILHQTKNYPTEFNLLSNGKYDASNWQDRNGGLVASMGLITPYAGESYTEDFAETVANYITRSDADYEYIYWCAERGWSTGNNSDDTDMSNAFCYYYYKNDDDRNNDVKTYTLRFWSDSHNSNIRLYADDGDYFLSPSEVEQYIADRTKELEDDYKNNQAWSRYNMSYSSLDDEQKSVVDDLTANVTFMFPVEDADNIDGKAILEQKISIARNWFRDSWGLDLDNLRKIVQRRSSDFNIQALLREIDEIQ